MKSIKIITIISIMCFLFSCANPELQMGVQNNQVNNSIQVEDKTESATANSYPQLSEGSDGTLVFTLQYLLNANGIACGVDGDFGSATESAVKTFQSRKGLVTDGIVGENTWNKLVITVQSGSNGNAVKALQYQLKNKLGYSIVVDGAFGSATTSAVKNYQGKCGIVQDGIVGPTTWKYVICGISQTSNTFTYNNIKNIIKAKGYTFYEGNYNLNLVGVRSSNRTANQWDDKFFLLYQENGVNKILSFNSFTADPGTYYLQNPMNSHGCAIVVPGQYKGLWKIGIHNGKYEALVQSGNIKVYRDSDRDNTLDMYTSTIETGNFGINLHHGGGSSVIGQYSAGCQVFKNPSDLTTVLNICKTSKNIYGNSFSYVLLNISDF